MKQNKRFNIFGWLSVSALLLTTACTDSADFSEKRNVGSDGMVTFTLSLQGQDIVTRGDDAHPPYHISDGSQVDELIFAIYTSDSQDGTYTISNEYSTESIKVSGSYTDYEDIKGDNGQLTGQMKITFAAGTLTSDTESAAAISLKIPVEEEVFYKVVCWAQNSTCTAYDTKDLAAVKVDYGSKEKPAANNDELRDAFCASKLFTSNTPDLKVILKRPFAQINVGTAGWDYEGPAILKPSAVSYTKSKITLDGVAQCYNVLDGHAVVTTAEDGDNNKYPLTTVTFDYNYLPAFIHYPGVENFIYTRYTLEEFLKIDLNGKDGIADYVDWTTYKAWSIAEQDGKLNDATYTGIQNPYDTETFKYLSMCYVLVPEASDRDIKEDVTYSAILNSIEFKTNGFEEGTEGTDGAEPIVFDAFTITNVPVQKNWRTNIVGFNMFTTRTKFNLWVVPEYCGDYNTFDKGEKWHNVEEDSDSKWDLTYPNAGDINEDFDGKYGGNYYPKSGSSDE